MPHLTATPPAAPRQRGGVCAQDGLFFRPTVKWVDVALCVVVGPVHDVTPDSGCACCPLFRQVFPREQPGLDYDLNWSLCDDGVAPHGDAFRNAPLKVLHQFCVDGKKAPLVGVVKAKAAPSYATLSTDGPTAIDLDEFDDKFGAVRVTPLLSGLVRTRSSHRPSPTAHARVPTQHIGITGC